MTHIKSLPPEYKKLAERNRENLESGVKDDLYISSAFLWAESPEGREFWNQVSNAYTEEALPPIPNE